ncbi:hypothetical protein ADENT20671_2057 [Actinomyces denticolens]|nr:hypothetical protein ADENT20671_2057 [Actinomyces denticolens]
MGAPVTRNGIELDRALDRVQSLLDAELVDAVEDLLLVDGDGGQRPPQRVILGDRALGDIVDGGRDRDLLGGGALPRDHRGGAMILGIGLAGIRHDGGGQGADRPRGVGEAERVPAVLDAWQRAAARAIGGHDRGRRARHHDQSQQEGGGECGCQSRSAECDAPGFFQGGGHGDLSGKEGKGLQEQGGDGSGRREPEP